MIQRDRLVQMFNLPVPKKLIISITENALNEIPVVQIHASCGALRMHDFAIVYHEMHIPPVQLCPVAVHIEQPSQARLCLDAEHKLHASLIAHNQLQLRWR